MGINPLFVFLVLTAALVTAEPLKKDIVHLPPLIHFSDVFNSHSDKEHDKLSELSGSTPTWPNRPGSPPYITGVSYPPVGGYLPPGSGYPPGGYPPGRYPPGGYPPGGYTPGGYPPGGYPPGGYPPGGYPPGGYPPGQYPGPYPPGGYYPQPYPPNPPLPPYPPYPSYNTPPAYPSYPAYPPRNLQDVELVERYCKFNDDGSKEYKLVLSNGLSIYQKVLTKRGNRHDIHLLEGYYADKRDDNTYLITHFKADDNGYTASSEISNSPPNYPDVKEMQILPLPAAAKRQKK